MRKLACHHTPELMDYKAPEADGQGNSDQSYPVFMTTALDSCGRPPYPAASLAGGRFGFANTAPAFSMNGEEASRSVADWTFAFDVLGDSYYPHQAAEHHRAVDHYIRKHGFRYNCAHTHDSTPGLPGRRYTVPRDIRDEPAVRQIFTKVFLKSTSSDIVHAELFPAKMSVVFESRPFIDGSYPSMDDPNDHVGDDVHGRYDDADVSHLAAAAANFTTPGATMLEDTEASMALQASVNDKEVSPAVSTPSRIKPIPKPERDIQKNANGYFECTWPNCTEDTKQFSRRCEWNKHMDKHERPYRCQAEGCEKLPGFTYSGGLLRHEREVHGKHGGPKNPLHCPHPNCKRHSGKGFSRQENLNEHLRRVHTGEGGAQVVTGEDTDDPVSEPSPGNKRKRNSIDDDGDLRGENKRLRQENDELRKQVEAQNRQTVAMMQTINQLRSLEPQLHQDSLTTTTAATAIM